MAAHLFKNITLFDKKVPLPGSRAVFGGEDSVPVPPLLPVHLGRHLVHQEPGGLDHILHMILPPRRLRHLLHAAAAVTAAAVTAAAAVSTAAAVTAAAVGQTGPAAAKSEITKDFLALLLLRGRIPPPSLLPLLCVGPTAARRMPHVPHVEGWLNRQKFSLKICIKIYLWQCCGSMTFWCGSGSADPCL
jgi:hypothetical protein